MPKPRNLRVYANPYVHLDHEGRPVSAYPCDPIYHTPDRRWVGATLGSELVEHRDPFHKVAASRDDRKHLHDIWFDFSAEVQEIPDTAHYRQAFRAGAGCPCAAFVPADEDTARTVGMAFRDPHDVLEEAAHGAIARWKQEYGDEPDAAIAHWASHLSALTGSPVKAEEH